MAVIEEACEAEPVAPREAQEGTDAQSEGLSEEEPLPEEEQERVAELQPASTSDVQSFALSLQEDAKRLHRASDAMLLGSKDDAFTDVQADVSRQLQQVDITDAIQESNNVLQELLNSQLLEEELYGPMRKITDKVLLFVEQIDPEEDVATVKEKLTAARELRKFGEEQREMALANVYGCIDKQMTQYCSAVEARNKMMRDAFTQVLQMYEQRIDAEVNARGKLLKMKQQEHAAMLETSRQMNQHRLECSRTAAEVAEMQLSTEARRDAAADAKKAKALERQAEKEQKKLELQQQREKQQHEKELRDMERQSQKVKNDLEQARKRDEVAHDKSIKDLDLQEKRGKIDQLKRAALQQELKTEMDRYNREFQLAQQAMQASIRGNGKSCKISHTAPKIEWGPPTPRVVPGSVSWETR